MIGKLVQVTPYVLIGAEAPPPTRVGLVTAVKHTYDCTDDDTDICTVLWSDGTESVWLAIQLAIIEENDA